MDKIEKTCRVRVSNKLFEDSRINEELIFRELATKLVKVMSFEELRGLFKFNVINPNSMISKEFVKWNNKEVEIEEMEKLSREGSILFSVKLK
tara:strand:+ start:281 stop:559 length:279 start_codon:yes stop_codon:yes gene_type:complete